MPPDKYHDSAEQMCHCKELTPLKGYDLIDFTVAFARFR